MTHEFYVTVQGNRQGRFKSETAREKHKDKIPGISFHYNVASPRDSASGMASGKRVHQPVSFVKRWGPATPQLFQALCTQEALTSVLFEFVDTDAQGEEYVFHTVTLTNAVVTEIDQYLDGGRHGEAPGERQGGRPGERRGAPPDAHELERISLTFQRIEIENRDGRTMATDDWHQRG